MIVDTCRFGAIEIAEDDVLLFPEGLVGLSRLKRFVLLRDPQSAELFWLQSLDEREFAFACIHSSKLGGPFELDLSEVDVDALKLTSSEDAEIFFIVNRVDGAFTANLKGPLVVNAVKSLGKQAVLTDPRYEVRHALLAARQPAMTA